MYNADTSNGFSYAVAFKNQLAISNITFGLQVTEFIKEKPFALAQFGTLRTNFLHQFAQLLSVYVKCRT